MTDSKPDRRDGPPPLGITARAIVDRVIDGDTIAVHVTWPLVVRLRDCWAPEPRGTSAIAGLAASEYLKTLLKPSQAVIVSIDSGHARSLGDVLSFGRVVGRVWIGKDAERSVSQLMVMAGHATEAKP